MVLLFSTASGQFWEDGIDQVTLARPLGLMFPRALDLSRSRGSRRISIFVHDRSLQYVGDGMGDITGETISSVIGKGSGGVSSWDESPVSCGIGEGGHSLPLISLEPLDRDRHRERRFFGDIYRSSNSVSIRSNPLSTRVSAIDDNG